MVPTFDDRSEGVTASDRCVLLLVLDGVGITEKAEHNAVRQANTPTLCHLRKDYPFTTLQSSGTAVGLAEGQMGNSNVGHLHLGAGRVLPQDVLRIDQAIDSGDFYSNHTLREHMRETQRRGGALHLMGLLSDGRVHSDQEHLYALLRMAHHQGVERVWVHAFLDGRDVPPKSAHQYLAALEDELLRYPTYHVATVMGRYYAMDRDHRWDRITRALDAIVRGEGHRGILPTGLLQRAYERGETDEFVAPSVVGEYQGTQLADGYICFNYRADRMRHLLHGFLHPSDQGWTGYAERLSAHVVTFTIYDGAFPFPVAFPALDTRETLGEVVSRAGLAQLRVAETEKYAHVTYFFNGGREAPFLGEARHLIPSPDVATYDQQPEMSAEEVTDVLVDALRSGTYSLIVANYANGDMVGHTGDFAAAVRAVETLDHCLARLMPVVLETGATALMVADHGNAEQMGEGASAHTAHTVNCVPCFLVGQTYIAPSAWTLRSGSLVDVAPTVLDILQLKPPSVMTGRTLRVRRDTEEE